MNPTVSITIPCRNEEAYIGKCIESILASNYPLELIQIYVCDGLSDDDTEEIVEKLSEKHPQVHLLINEKKTTPFALNLGLKTSKEDIKIILGAHAEIDANFIKENVAIFKLDEKIGCAGGIIENVYESETAETIGLAMSSSFGVGNAHFRTGNKDGYVDTVAFGAYKKEIFDTIGYFDEELARNQDDEFNYRLLKNDYKIYLSKKIKSKYYVRGSYSNLFKQYFQYGYWKVFVNKKHQTVTTIRQLVPMLFVIYLISGIFLIQLDPFAMFIEADLMELWTLGCLPYIIFSFYSSIKITSQYEKVFKLVFTFFILHTSYGLGYLKGIFNFILFRKEPSKKAESLTR